MTKLLLIGILLMPRLLFAQSPIDPPESSADIHYYPFYNGVQMVEIDYLTSYHRFMNYFNATRSSSSHRNMFTESYPNVYLFRNEKGEIIKQYGQIYKQYGQINDVQILSVEESLKRVKPHDAPEAQMGTTISSFPSDPYRTRYFPYYLIGSMNVWVSTDSAVSEKLGLIDSFGNLVLPQEYHEIWQNGNIFITLKDSIYELRDINLRVRFSGHQFEFALQPSYYNKGFADVFIDNERGLMDSTGRIIVPCEYETIYTFNELGLAQVVKNGLFGFVDTAGNERIECKYQHVGHFKEELVDAWYGDKCGYLDADGKTVIPHQFSGGSSFYEGLARVCRREGNHSFYGFIDKEGNVVIPLIYTNARDFKKGTVQVEVDGKWILIDKTGKVVE